ncbi:MAG: hypothetical protein JWM98_116 [Thermoleophilia bacterium]|nr:hypothetical protein [Thermoleophilia bacterium]
MVVRPSRGERSDAIDVASIVLAGAPTRARRARRARAPIAPSWSEPTYSGLGGGYDARSALVLALVVAGLVMAIAWTVSIGRDGIGSATPSAPAAKVAAKLDVAPAAAAIGPVAAPAARIPATVRGVDLAPGRVSTSRAASGSTLVRIGVVDAGTRPLVDGSGARVVVLLDAAVAGQAPLPGIGSRGARVVAEVTLDRCEPGVHTLTVVIDPGAAVRDADLTDNAVGRRVSITC